MSIPVDSKSIVDVLELVEQIPAAGGYIIAMVGFSAFAIILAIGARSSQRSLAAQQQSMHSVVEATEKLRASMIKDIEKYEEKCRKCQEEVDAKDEIIEQLRVDRDELIRHHTAARQTLLEQDRAWQEAHRNAMREEQRLREELASMVHTVSILTTKLDNANNLRRATDE